MLNRGLIGIEEGVEVEQDDRDLIGELFYSRVSAWHELRDYMHTPSRTHQHIPSQGRASRSGRGSRVH